MESICIINSRYHGSDILTLTYWQLDCTPTCKIQGSLPSTGPTPKIGFLKLGTRRFQIRVSPHSTVFACIPFTSWETRWISIQRNSKARQNFHVPSNKPWGVFDARQKMKGVTVECSTGSLCSAKVWISARQRITLFHYHNLLWQHANTVLLLVGGGQLFFVCKIVVGVRWKFKRNFKANWIIQNFRSANVLGKLTYLIYWWFRKESFVTQRFHYPQKMHQKILTLNENLDRLILKVKETPKKDALFTFFVFSFVFSVVVVFACMGFTGFSIDLGKGKKNIRNLWKKRLI